MTWLGLLIWNGLICSPHIYFDSVQQQPMHEWERKGCLAVKISRQTTDDVGLSHSDVKTAKKNGQQDATLT